MNREIPPIPLADISVTPYASIDELLEHVFTKTGEIIPGVAVAVNPEKVLKSMNDPEAKKIINEATIRYADGIGVVKALSKKSGKPLKRIAGADLWLKILEHSVLFQSRVMLIGAKQETVQRCSAKLKSCGVNVIGYKNGYFTNNNTATELVLKTKPNIVIVAQGSPKQEKLISTLRSVYPEAFYMGVGGSFDILAGNVKRAPDFWVDRNLEWLYRLLSDPKRIFRQTKLLKFAYLYWFNKL